MPNGGLVTAGPQLGAAARLDIYRRSYISRLEECLADDYPALQDAMGEDRFGGVCRQYIERHPPSHPSLNGYGQHFSLHCSGLSWRDFPTDFAAELAELEWCLVEAIHAPASPPLAVDGLHPPLSAGHLTEARLLFNPSLRVRKFRYPVSDYFQRWVDGLDREVPRRKATVTAVFRSGYRIVRVTLPPARAALLDLLLEGTPLSSAVMQMQKDGWLERLDGPTLTSWFQEWVAEGWIAGIELDAYAIANRGVHRRRKKPFTT
jgi:hypothetical protein